jgi:gliding motility-associated-like protein
VIVAGGNGYGSGPSQLDESFNVFVDNSGNVDVSDWSNQRVQKWAPGATEGITVATIYTLNVIADGGCTASGKVTVDVYTPLSIANAFTPNGDGHNDVLYAMGGPAGSKVSTFNVYDRWGQCVFRVHDVAPGDRQYGRNGSIGGRPAPAGTYIYIWC